MMRFIRRITAPEMTPEHDAQWARIEAHGGRHGWPVQARYAGGDGDARFDMTIVDMDEDRMVTVNREWFDERKRRRMSTVCEEAHAATIDPKRLDAWITCADHLRDPDAWR